MVFLQHTRESRVSIGTARMAHLGLANSELHEGIEFGTGSPAARWFPRPGTFLLFPGEGALDPGELAEPPETLVVIDGTWPQARKLLSLNPALRALPRIGFRPRRPGNYRIRREPAEHCVATVEAVVEVLALLERDEARFEPLIRAFTSMVDFQIAAKERRTTPPRRRLKPAPPWWTAAGMPDLEALWPRLVAVAGEANAHRRDSGVPGLPELVHLVAVRPATGETFESFVAPRRPLAPAAPFHLEVGRDDLLGGRAVPEVIGDWDRFLGPDSVLAGWGGFAWELLAQEGWHPRHAPVDLRVVGAQRLHRRPGSPEGAATAMGLDGTKVETGQGSGLSGRAGRNVRHLAALLALLRDEIRTGRAAGIGSAPKEGPEPAA